jgi:hypothetical protein
MAEYPAESQLLAEFQLALGEIHRGDYNEADSENSASF